ncbi:hypothetical protein NBO_926g0001 [Nosema bombycis CQ1]|uniref:Uncharacterized protein n=1 Tax=Nosema bombycis (strain CQ1 / CVCC 102059) TaxID=578461 RepID=R0KM34_NOSB1|nr:hypothetical protein NBO_926g0001 [Nosema bombycis CQ1]|eukprot:EOB11716.1 hypothetical protein NBO_926g0001 [Nosema bombycis CQ1]
MALKTFLKAPSPRTTFNFLYLFMALSSSGDSTISGIISIGRPAASLAITSSASIILFSNKSLLIKSFLSFIQGLFMFFF